MASNLWIATVPGCGQWWILAAFTHSSGHTAIRVYESLVAHDDQASARVCVTSLRKINLCQNDLTDDDIWQHARLSFRQLARQLYPYGPPSMLYQQYMANARQRWAGMEEVHVICHQRRFPRRGKKHDK